MDLVNTLQIFYQAYTQRWSELDLPETECVKLLEARYPKLPPCPGKIPLLKERIKIRLDELSCTDRPEEETLAVEEIHLLYAQAYFEYRLLDKYDRRFQTLFSVLNAYVGSKYRFPNDENSVRQLAECTVDLWLVSKHFREHQLGDRLPEIAAAAGRLSRLNGQPVVVENGKIVLSSEFLAPIHAELERRMELAGGIPFLKRLFQEVLFPRFDGEMGRYMIHRQSRSYYQPNEKPVLEVPFGYLFQLAVKHLFPPAPDIHPRTGEGYKELIALAMDVLMVHDVSRSYSTSHAFVTIKELPEYISKNSALDVLCLPPQYAPEFSLMVLDMYEKKRRELLPELSGLKEVARACLEQPCCALFSDQMIAKQTGLPLSRVRHILGIFSLPWDQVNQDYQRPIAPVNQWGWPLIQAPDLHQFFLLSPCFSGYAFCQRLEALLIPQKPALQRQLGDDVEDLVEQMLTDIPHHHNGYYEEREPGKKGKTSRIEFDFILEDDENILFLEVKKHALGGGFQQASDIDIFSDLTRGMLKAHVQAYRRRLALTAKGTLPLYRSANGKYPYATLELKDRRVHTMSICLPEYAFFTQTFLAKKLIQALLVGSFHASDPAYDPRLSELNELAKKFQKLCGPYLAKEMGGLRSFIRHSYFRSLQQLWMVRRICSKERTIDCLTWDRSIMLSPLDFYAGLKYARNWL